MTVAQIRALRQRVNREYWGAIGYGGGNYSVIHVALAEELCAAIDALLALVAQARDEEAEACLQIVEGAVMRAVDSADALAAIRARIAARAEGGKHE